MDGTAGSRYEYDAFISYAREDQEWALRLREDLERKGLRTFIDQESLRAGRQWNPQLNAAIQASRHLIVLWSNAAEKSPWVAQEIHRFAAFADMTKDVRVTVGVVLEGASPWLDNLQMVTAIADEAAYEGGAEAIDGDVWRRVVDKVADGVADDQESLPIPVLVVTSTRSDMENVRADQRPPMEGGIALETLLTDLEIGTPADLLRSYGDRRGDWRPFGSDRNVSSILSELQDAINEILRAQERSERFRWDFIDEEFWTGSDAVRRVELGRLMRGPALVVVDPLAFYDNAVLFHYGNTLTEAFDNPDAYFLVLAPFRLPRSHARLREAIRQLASRVFQHYYEPPVYRRRGYARSSANIGDAEDLKGWAMTALAPKLASERERTPNPYLEPAGLRP